jgi:polyhydroxyalkanoate synthesis regulator phasin
MEVVAANVGEFERQSTKESVLRDFIRFTWRVSRGLSTGAESEGRELVSRMVMTGKVTPEQGEQLIAALAAKMNAGRQAFESRVETIVRETVKKVEAVAEKEVGRISEQLATVEKRLERLTTKPGK